MRVENSPNRFIISPAKSIVIFDLCVALIVLATLIVSPIISSAKIIVTALVACYSLVTFRQYKRAIASEIQYLPLTKQWLHNGTLVSLCNQQFITRHLVVMYFRDKNGSKISQVIPQDSLPKKQHIQLRKLVIAWSKTANRDE
jgi:hypothetical protein